MIRVGHVVVVIALAVPYAWAAAPAVVWNSSSANGRLAVTVENHHTQPMTGFLIILYPETTGRENAG